MNTSELGNTQEISDSKRRGAPPTSNGGTFASFVHRNYRLWFTGQSASLIGTWMQTTAQAYLIYSITQSPVYLGYIGFASGIPTWLFSLVAGVLSDRVSRRNIMVVTQTAMMLLAFILAWLTFTGKVMPWEIVVLAFLTGIANAFDAPCRQTLVVELVDRENLSNAIALNSSIFNLGTAIGPAIAGVAYALWGPGWCFTINGISFLAVIVALLMIDLKPQPKRTRTSSPMEEMREGFRYITATPTVGLMLLIISVTTIFGLSFATLFPAWAVQMLHGDATTNGFLQAIRGVGSLVGALFVASIVHRKIRGRMLALGALVYPIVMLIWAFTLWLPGSLLILTIVGLGTMLVINMTNILTQALIPDHLRGRVMSIYNLCFFGLMPVGALLYGAAAEGLGEQRTVILGAVISLLLLGWIYLRNPRLFTLE